jgi:pilus assembly protein CpaD
MVRSYRVNEATLATIHVSYPKITAQAGPCGMWPKNIGPGAERDYFENQPYWNFGCAYQRNLAAMVDNPTDLVQPRAETPAYTARRTVVLDKYRQGQATATQYPNATAGKISDVGQ